MNDQKANEVSQVELLERDVHIQFNELRREREKYNQFANEIKSIVADPRLPLELRRQIYRRVDKFLNPIY